MPPPSPNPKGDDGVLFITASLVTQKQLKNKLSNHKRTVCTEKAAMLLKFQTPETESLTQL